MDVVRRPPMMSRTDFFDWAQAQEARHEFNGFEPVAMTGGTVDHSQITQNILAALRPRLKGSSCRPLGPDAGVATVGEAVRYPDALIACGRIDGDAQLVPGVVAVFEVLSPSSGRIDRIVKLREYRAVPSVRYYAIPEQAGIGLTLFSRRGADQDWTATALTAEDTLRLPELGIDIPVSELYADVEFSFDSRLDGR